MNNKKRKKIYNFLTKRVLQNGADDLVQRHFEKRNATDAEERAGLVTMVE
jgi:hypothetical protein